MKQILLYTAVATGLIFNTGCGKQEQEVPEKPAIQIPETVTETKAQVEAKAQEVIQQAKETVQSITVKAEDIINELSEPVASVKEKVAAASQPELLAYADQYKTAILEKKDQLAGLTAQLKDLPMTDLFSEKGKALKDKVAEYTGQLTALKERYSIYLDKLKEFGVDLSAYGI